MEWKHDWGLTARVWLTMFLLFIVYLVLMSILWMLGFGVGLIVLLAVVVAFVQYFFSDKLVLWIHMLVSSARMNILTPPDSPKTV